MESAGELLLFPDARTQQNINELQRLLRKSMVNPNTEWHSKTEYKK